MIDPIGFIYVHREYFLRRVREEFRQNRDVRDSSKITALLKRGEENLQTIRRQVRLTRRYIFE